MNDFWGFGGNTYDISGFKPGSVLKYHLRQAQGPCGTLASNPGLLCGRQTCYLLYYCSGLR